MLVTIETTEPETIDAHAIKEAIEALDYFVYEVVLIPVS